MPISSLLMLGTHSFSGGRGGGGRGEREGGLITGMIKGIYRVKEGVHL